MKRVFCAVLVLLTVVFGMSSLADEFGFDKMNRQELKEYQQKIDEQIKLNHRVNSDQEARTLEAAKRYVEELFGKRDIEVSWPWFNYDYTRAWNYYTFDTYISYHEGKEKRKPDLHAELVDRDGQMAVVFLQIGNDVVLDNRKEAQDPRIDNSTELSPSIALTDMNSSMLNDLKARIDKEIKTNHTTSYSQEEAALGAVKNYVDQHFGEQGIDVSWPWFNYSYTREWNRYTVNTSISYKEGKEKRNPDIYAEVIDNDGVYKLLYLKIGNEDFLDNRDAKVDVSDATDNTNLINSKTKDVPEPTQNPKEPPKEAEQTSDSASLVSQSEENSNAVDAVSEDKVADEAVESDNSTETVPELTTPPPPTTLKKGEKGDHVRDIQLRLRQLGYFQGTANGNFDYKTESAVKNFQKAYKLERTGIVTDVELKQLTEVSREFMKRAAVVAMTNAQALDVYKADRETYDVSKFHKYAKIHDTYMSIQSEGKWREVDASTWHVDRLLLKIENYDMWLKASMDVTFDGKNYVVSHVEKVMATEAYIDSDDPARTTGVSKLEPSKASPYLTVSPWLVKEDRDLEAEKSLQTKIAEKKVYEEKRKDWIGSQFSFWNGSHKELEKLIKSNLNDERSYRHIETMHFDISDEAALKEMKNVLRKAGFQPRLKLGDFVILTEFSAKNAFGATIKSVALGVASFDDDTITLVAIK